MIEGDSKNTMDLLDSNQPIDIACYRINEMQD